MALPALLTTPPRRRLGVQVLVQNLAGAVLLVETAHRDGFTLPGGCVEENELPHLAARRHLETVTGLVLPLRAVVAVDFVPAQTVPDGVSLVFWGGRLTGAQEQAVARHGTPEEIKGLHWLHGARIEAAVGPAQYRRLQAATDAVRRGRTLPLLLRGLPAA